MTHSPRSNLRRRACIDAAQVWMDMALESLDRATIDLTARRAKFGAALRNGGNGDDMSDVIDHAVLALVRLSENYRLDAGMSAAFELRRLDEDGDTGIVFPEFDPQ